MLYGYLALWLNGYNMAVWLNGFMVICGRPIDNWSVLYTPTWGDKLAQRVRGWEVGALVLFGKYEDVIFLLFNIILISYPDFLESLKRF